MAIQASDLKEYKSTVEDDTDSCGGAISANEITSGQDNNLFPDITGEEAESGVTKHRKAFRKNTNATDAWYAVKTWITQQPTNCALHVALGLDHADDIKGKLSELMAFSAAALVALVSDGADTRNVDIVGEDSSGDRISETVALNGTNEVLSTNTYSKVYMVSVQSLDASRTVTIKEGSGGTTRGTIGTNGKLCTCFRTGTDIDAKDEGFRQGDIAAGNNFGLWYKLVVPASAGSVQANTCKTKSEGDTA